MMASPLIDEALMERLLSTPPDAAVDAVCRLQYGAVMLILNAFDRKVTRENFADILDKSASLIDGAGRLGAFTATTRSENLRNKEIIEGAQRKLSDEIASRARQCAHLAEVLKQCAHDEDAIN